MDCMASKAATKNGLVLPSLPAASGILVQSPRATTECEFDLASKSRSSKSGSASDRNTANTMFNRHHDDQTSMMARVDQLKAKPLRGDPSGRP
jgi:hypothetical protein